MDRSVAQVVAVYGTLKACCMFGVDASGKCICVCVIPVTQDY